MNIPAAGAPGVVRLASSHSVATTAERLKSLLREHGVLLFAHIDFAADAARAGLSMRPAQLLLFGNPKGGTPLLQSEPTVGLDLPLKALIWEDAGGRVTVAFNDPLYLVQRHGLPESLAANISGVTALLERAAAAG